MILYCVGCGQAIAEMPDDNQSHTLAISCACGAIAPILYTDDYMISIPVSLLPGVRGNLLPHLEYYLGFSDHKSTLKEVVTTALRKLGSISFTECPDQECRRSFTLAKLRYERMFEKQKKG